MPPVFKTTNRPMLSDLTRAKKQRNQKSPQRGATEGDYEEPNHSRAVDGAYAPFGSRLE
ncbi:hypothetical protein CISG_02078 [Coccidioides immitis RMSCC 3703]|uniref:Uncharacterized protein n=2 Tax=Coccidioides immitis TaxID=5501 RepID=A0A0J8R3C8_COCIT|nr:hypothetical protein CIRG_07734 [Coccidioides immitis RMSCC 2394]KMU79659.1 hypothetical protein CISG_02078 [Coccidioides immitis RMSCC 3703]